MYTVVDGRRECSIISLYRKILCFPGLRNYFSSCQGSYVNKLIKDFAGSMENIEKVDTYRHLKGEQRVPLLCIHGDKEPLVELECSASFVSKVNELSPGKAELLVVKDGLHSNLAALFWGDIEALITLFSLMKIIFKK